MVHMMFQRVGISIYIYIYTHCDLTNYEGYMIVILTIGSYFVTSFSPCLNIGGFIQISKFGVTFCKKFEKGD